MQYNQWHLVQVECRYRDFFVCQSPLISTLKGINLTIDGEKVPDIKTSDLRQWFFNSTPASRTSKKIMISFPKMVLIRYLFTAWNVTSLTYHVNKTFNRIQNNHIMTILFYQFQCYYGNRKLCFPVVLNCFPKS